LNIEPVAKFFEKITLTSSGSSVSLNDKLFASVINFYLALFA
jgi:hypothetical protein